MIYVDHMTGQLQQYDQAYLNDVHVHKHLTICICNYKVHGLTANQNQGHWSISIDLSYLL